MIVFNIVILVMQQHDQTVGFMPFAAPAPYTPQPGEILVKCERCGWHGYYTPDRARRGLAGHRNWCNREH